jgi:hypothetical protein
MRPDAFGCGKMLVTNPPPLYCRTDIGGAYRWNSTNNSWVQLLDFQPARIYLFSGQ